MFKNYIQKKLHEDLSYEHYKDKDGNIVYQNIKDKDGKPIDFETAVKGYAAEEAEQARKNGEYAGRESGLMQGRSEGNVEGRKTAYKNSAITVGATAAGAVGLYAANQIRKHSEWKRYGCGSIKDSVEKAKCQKYVSKKKG